MHEIISPPPPPSPRYIDRPFLFPASIFFSLPPPLVFSGVVRYRGRPETGSTFSDRDDDAYRVMIQLPPPIPKLVETSVYRGRGFKLFFFTCREVSSRENAGGLQLAAVQQQNAAKRKFWNPSSSCLQWELINGNCAVKSCWSLFESDANGSAAK